MINVKEIRASQSVLGKYAQHLVTHPKDMIQLIKEDINLGYEYAKIFTQEQVITLFRVAQQENIKLLEQISAHQLAVKPLKGDALTLPPLDFTSDVNVNEPAVQERMVDTIQKNGKLQRSSNEYDGCDYKFEGMVVWSYDWENCVTYRSDNIAKAYNKLKNIEVMPERIAELQRKHALAVQAENLKVFDILNLFFSAIPRHPLLDAEFKISNSGQHSTFFSRVFTYRPAESQVFERVTAAKHYDLLSKMLENVSPSVALYELNRHNAAGKSCLRSVIDDLPNAQRVVQSMIGVMAVMFDEELQKSMEIGNFDVLEALQRKAPVLAQAFFDTKPGVVRALYPASASTMGAVMARNAF